MGTHSGLELSTFIAEADTELDGLKEYATVLINRIGITDPEDPQYKEVIKLQEGILEKSSERQEYFRHCLSTCLDNVDDNFILGED